MSKLIIFDLDGTLINTLNDVQSDDMRLFDYLYNNFDLAEVRVLLGVIRLFAYVHNDFQEVHAKFPNVPANVREIFKSSYISRTVLSHGVGIRRDTLVFIRLLLEEAAKRANITLPYGLLDDETSGFVDFINKKYHHFYFDFTTDKSTFFEGVEMALEKINSLGYQMALLSNKQEDTVKRIVEDFKIDKHFKIVAGYDTYDSSKPDAGGLLAIAEKLGFKVDDCVVVGDNFVEIEAGVNAGMKTVFCSYGYGFVREENKPNYIIQNMYDLIPILEAIDKA